jgi:hypothetical protein
MCMSSIPARAMAADQSDLNPSIGRVIRLIARWVLIHDIIQILCLPQFNVDLMVGVALFYRRRMGATLVDVNLLRCATLVDGFAQKA